MLHLTFSLHCLHCHPLSTASTSCISSTCGNYYGEFGRGMYVLNLNRCLKVEDSCSPLSCNTVKVSFQIKKRPFDLPNIVFSPFRGWKWSTLSLISLPALSSLIHTHIQNKHTWLKYFMVCVMEWSGFNARVPRSKKYKQHNNDAYKSLTDLMQRNFDSVSLKNIRGCPNSIFPLHPLHLYLLFHPPQFTCCQLWQKDPAAGFYLTRAP